MMCYFGGQDGFLIKFDNYLGFGKGAKGFDVSWISRYGSQEAERYTSNTFINYPPLSYMIKQNI